MSTLTRQETSAAASIQHTSSLRNAGLGVVAALIFALDVVTPFGFAAPVLYVLLVCDAMQSQRAARLAQVAAVSTLLTVAGGILAPVTDVPLWAGIMNRVIAV